LPLPGIPDLGEENLAGSIVGECLRGESYIVINPNASELRMERRWPKERFVELIACLKEIYPDMLIVLIGSPGERDYVESLIEQIRDQKGVVNLAGRTSLPELVALLSKALLLVSNDSGPMHIAFSLRMKTVALFGPCHPEQYGCDRIHDNVYVIYRSVYCSPCVHDFPEPPCKGNNQCMQMITVEDVVHGVRHLMEGEIPTVSGERDEIIYYSNGVLGEVRRERVLPGVGS